MLREFIETAPVALAMVDADRQYIAASPRWRADHSLGETPLAGRCICDDLTGPPGTWASILERCLRGERARHDEERALDAAGGSQWRHWHVQPWRRDDGAVGGLIVFHEVRDVAGRTRAEPALRDSDQRQRYLLALTDALQSLSDPEDIQFTAVRVLAQHLGVQRAAYADIVDEREIVVARDYADGVPSIAGRAALAGLGDSAMATFKRGDVLVSADLEADTSLPPHVREAFRGTGAGALAATGLVRAGRWVAAVGVQAMGPRAWTALELELLRETADRCWLAVERARTESALRESEERLRLALEASSASTWSWDVARDRCTWDLRVGEPCGRTGETTTSLQEWLSIVHEGDRGRVRARLDELRRGQGGDVWDLEFRVVRGVGTECWIHGLGHAQRAPDGRVSRLLGLQLDVTARKQTEAALHASIEARERALADLREGRERLDLALEAAAAGSWTLDLAAGEGQADPRTCARMGLPAGRPFRIDELLSRIHPDDRALAQATIDTVRQGSGSDGWQMDYRVLCADGPVRWCHSLGRAERDGAGRAVRVSGISLDITSRKEAEFAVVRAHRDLEARAAELERRTAQLVQLASQLTLAEQHARERLAKTLHDHLQQLLFSSRLTLERTSSRLAEGRSIQPELVDRARRELDEAIAAARTLAVELCPPMLHRGGLPAALEWLAGWLQETYNVRVDLTADARANPERRDLRTLVFESVRELLFNAVKHAGVDRVSLDLRLIPPDDILIVVADEGRGFESAVVLHPDHPRPSGLGLYSLRERLALFGARMEVESAPGRGARFSLLVPLSAEPLLRNAVDAPADGRAGRPLRVLIADDHALVRDGLRELLGERRELRVVGEAADGREAVAQAHLLRPDVVIMDVVMPEMDGVEATRRIRSELPSIEVFGLSTEERLDRLHAIEEAGASGYFSKSEDTRRLVDRLLALQMRDRVTSR